MSTVVGTKRRDMRDWNVEISPSNINIFQIKPNAIMLFNHAGC